MSLSGIIHVLLVEPHEIVRTGITAIFSQTPDINLIAETAYLERTLLLCREHHPDVVILNLMRAGMHSAEVIAALRREFPRTQVIVLSATYNRELLSALLRAGVIACLSPAASAHELVHAVRVGRCGKPSFAPEATAVMVREFGDGLTPDMVLTPRETEILSLLVQGLTNREIALRLHVSRFTVKNHVSRLLAKMGAASRTQAVALALQQELVRVD